MSESETTFHFGRSEFLALKELLTVSFKIVSHK